MPTPLMYLVTVCRYPTPLSGSRTEGFYAVVAKNADEAEALVQTDLERVPANSTIEPLSENYQIERERTTLYLNATEYEKTHCFYLDETTRRTPPLGTGLEGF